LKMAWAPLGHGIIIVLSGASARSIALLRGGQTMKNKITNRQFASTNEKFLAACKEVATLNRYQDFRPSQRQASKWRLRKGIAWKEYGSYALS